MSVSIALPLSSYTGAIAYVKVLSLMLISSASVKVFLASVDNMNSFSLLAISLTWFCKSVLESSVWSLSYND